MDWDAQFLLQCVDCLRINGNTRDFVGQALQQSKTEDLAFSLLIHKKYNASLPFIVPFFQCWSVTKYFYLITSACRVGFANLCARMAFRRNCLFFTVGDLKSGVLL